MKRAGMVLVVMGLLALVFFLATDPLVMPGWTEKVGWGRSQVGPYGQADAVSDARWGTVIGVAGSAAIIVSGLWLLLRKSI